MEQQPVRRRRRKKSLWKKYRWWIVGAAALLLTAGIVGTVLALARDPYKKVLNTVGIEPAEYRKEKQTVTVTFENDAEGVLLCREALNAWRAAEDHPKTVRWTVTGGKMPVKGTVENLDFRPEPQSPRVETLGEAITKVKLVGALTESNVSAEIEFLPTLGADGKTVSIRVESMEEDVKADLAPVLTAIRAVNEEGGGIVRYNVEFYQKESFIACASYDLLYGDEIISSLLSQE